ncbi:hypothetical protein DFJ58DRAFT_773932 [Suillus subalutaceus]|uniref:uncharacterized protein n=1 Tax=Suillus subalutaceus TaxID=48586 RepID=UPI001B88316F|nr:uncharacterized protein DFJ58DRAFT_773932 [Suillus subalutaceus]KAG1863586.1 hypothetical protein DFJ58DRAFT_773932 [Suillus subalutaceus]
MTDVQDRVSHTMLPVEHMALAVQSFSSPPSLTPTPVIFPPKDISETYTHASYSKESIPELVNNDQGNWMFSLNVLIPDEMVYPTLTSLEYTIKYGTANGQGTSTIQTSILLTKASNSSSDVESTRVLDGIITNTPKISIYRTGVGFPPQILNGVPTVCLLSVPAVKENCNTSQWNHYVDRQQFLPHVRIIEASRLYLQLHVAESSSPIMLRSLVAEVSATWVEDLQGKVLHDKIQAARMRKAVAESKRAEDEQARLQAERKSAQAKLARSKAEEEEKSAKKKSEYDQLAKKLADEQADRHRIAKEQAVALVETHSVAKKAADAAAHQLNIRQE